MLQPDIARPAPTRTAAKMRGNLISQKTVCSPECPALPAVPLIKTWYIRSPGDLSNFPTLNETNIRKIRKMNKMIEILSGYHPAGIFSWMMASPMFLFIRLIPSYRVPLTFDLLDKEKRSSKDPDWLGEFSNLDESFIHSPPIN